MTKALITVDHLTYQYSNTNKPALQAVSCQVPVNSWTVIVGKNGSGKSTLAQLIAGLKPFNDGSVTVNGISVDGKHQDELRQQIAYLFQDPDNQFVGATVADDVAFGLENRAVDVQTMDRRVDQSLDLVNMSSFADARPEHLSGGQKQRVALAGAFATNPRLLILDEATSMIDPQGRAAMFTAIQKRQQDTGMTVLSITHDDDEIEYADYEIVMADGQIVASGPPATASRFDYIPTPAGERLRRKLAARGVVVPPHYMTTKEMSQWIASRLNSNQLP